MLHKNSFVCSVLQLPYVRANSFAVFGFHQSEIIKNNIYTRVKLSALNMQHGH
jgi:hypothetical protein